MAYYQITEGLGGYASFAKTEVQLAPIGEPPKLSALCKPSHFSTVVLGRPLDLLFTQLVTVYAFI